MTTTAPTGIAIDLRRATHLDAGRWATKKAALAALTALRDRGINLDRHIETNEAETYLARFWVITRPDHHEVTTSLMTVDGTWLTGRLSDAPPCFCPHRCRGKHPAPWTRLDRRPVPASITHTYRYSEGSQPVSDGNGKTLMTGGGLGIAPVEVLAWSTRAWCIACTWSAQDSNEAVTRAAARYHLAHPGEYADYLTPRTTTV